MDYLKDVERAIGTSRRVERGVCVKSYLLTFTLAFVVITILRPALVLSEDHDKVQTVSLLKVGMFSLIVASVTQYFSIPFVF